jgi:predicted neuraminidase
MKKFIMIAILGIVSAQISAQNPFKGEQCIIKSEFIFQTGDVVFPSCHASTIIEIKKVLLAAWFGGTAEKNPDVGIWMSLFENGKWTRPVEVANGVQHKDKRYPCWNPVLYASGDEILLFYKVGPSPSAWWGELITSHDNGKTWSRSLRLPEDIIGPVKNKPVRLNNGELLCPSSTENDGWRVHLEFTSDNGNSWELTPPLNEKNIGIIQPAILTYPSGLIQMLCRSRQSKVLTSWSENNGRSWSEFVSSGLPNPNSGIDAVTLKDGRQLIVYNHLTTGRNMLNVAISDNGKEWEAAALPENDKKGTEYSYPAVIQTNDGLVHITYTWNRKQIKHLILNPEKISTRLIINGEWPAE